MISTHRLLQLSDLQTTLQIKLNTMLVTAQKQAQRHNYKSSQYRFEKAAKIERILTKLNTRLAQYV